MADNQYELYEEYRNDDGSKEPPIVMWLRRESAPDPAYYVVIDRVEAYGDNKDGSTWTKTAVIDEPTRFSKAEWGVMKNVALPPGFSWQTDEEAQAANEEAAKLQAAAEKKAEKEVEKEVEAAEKEAEEDFEAAAAAAEAAEEDADTPAEKAPSHATKDVAPEKAATPPAETSKPESKAPSGGSSKRKSSGK